MQTVSASKKTKANSPDKNSVPDTPTVEVTIGTEDAVNAFVMLIREGVKSWVGAGKILVSALEKNKTFGDKVREAHPEISREMLCTFERIGRNQIHAPLLADSSCGGRALLEMPYAVQVKYYSEPIPVVVNPTTGEIANRKIYELNRAEVRQVFDTTYRLVISPKDQITAINERRKHAGNATFPTAAPVAKRISRLGCYTITMQGSKPVLTEVKETYRAQQVRVTKLMDAEYLSAEILLYVDI